MKLRKSHWFGIAGGILVILISLFFMGEDIFFFLVGIALVVIGVPFIVTLIIEGEKTKEREEMFLNFMRDLVEGVNSGTPISKGIINLRNRNYGSLSPHIKKLANQISLGISVRESLENFSNDLNINAISRAVSMIGQAEEAGGEIGKILDSVAKSVSTTDKLKKERRAVISNLVVQGYIIFMIFIVIVLVMQFRIVPLMTEFTDVGSIENVAGIGGVYNLQEISSDAVGTAFLMLLIVQGFFTGLVIGKMAEGTFKAGIKHSFFLVVISLLIFTGARLFF